MVVGETPPLRCGWWAGRPRPCKVYCGRGDPVPTMRMAGGDTAPTDVYGGRGDPDPTDVYGGRGDPDPAKCIVGGETPSGRCKMRVLHL